MKRECFKCHNILESDSFYKNNGKWAQDKLKGLTRWCKDCMRKQRLKRGVDHENEVSRIRDAKHRDAMDEQYWKKLSKFHHLNYLKVIEQFNKQNKLCYYCKVPVTGKNLNIDHYYPRKDDKIVIACVECNRLKWNTNGDEFIVFLREYVSRFNEVFSPTRKSE
jgi:hypothetical protein